MKIVYVLSSNLVCGGHIVVLQHITRLAARGHDVSICLLNDNIPANVDSFAWFPGFSSKVFHLKDFPNSVDICVATFWATAFTVLKLPAKYKVYFVQSDETRFYADERTKTQVLLTYLCKFHHMTEAKWIVRWLQENFGHSAEYIPNGLDENIVYQVEPIEPKPKDKLRILVEGSISSPFKRIKESLEACQGLNCEVWCVSNDGKPSPDWQIDKFFYKVDFDKMKSIYSSCDILLKLSSVEGVFGPPLEMMACGGVCVVSDVTGYDEYIEDEYNALVVPNGDIDLARSALQRLISDQSLYLKLQKNGIATAESIRWEQSIDKLESFFQKLISTKEREHYTNGNIAEGFYQSLFKIPNNDYLNIDLQQTNDVNVLKENVLALASKISAMESSKFWKLRKLWFKIKTKLGLSKE
jgi:glycosyltransferase involved in cell wall biosynthesis